jgi:histidyl-tRNA synthetase
MAGDKKQNGPKGKPTTATQLPNAFVVSQYFGFKGMTLPDVTSEDTENALKVRDTGAYEHDIMQPLEEPLALLRTVKDTNFEETEEPLMLYCEGCAKGSSRKLKRSEKLVHLHIIGTPKSIAEATLIKTALCILHEEGFTDVTVEINNVGGRDSFGTFVRELTSHYRKHINDMDTECRQLFKDGPHALVACGTTLKPEIKTQAPSPLNYLSDENRQHFKEVIEFLESQNIPYDINKDILGNPHYSTNTVFTIIDKTSGNILATGSRYNQLAKKAGIRKEIPSVGVTLRLADLKQVPAARMHKESSVRFFFIQLGYQAKLKSLEVIDMLRHAKIPVHQSISRDKLSSQLARAKKHQVPYVLIMGQKEAHDGTVVVRDVESHSQISVAIPDLINYLKHLP